MCRYLCTLLHHISIKLGEAFRIFRVRAMFGHELKKPPQPRRNFGKWRNIIRGKSERLLYLVLNTTDDNIICAFVFLLFK